MTNKDPKERQVGSQQRQVASFVAFLYGFRLKLNFGNPWMSGYYKNASVQKNSEKKTTKQQKLYSQPCLLMTISNFLDHVFRYSE